ncbi:OLC1v1037760C1 [Oldenlandia corymbosa var. corymbosa]|uniref:OLC1v1037760C1 n=1 Tax=Oldenlandia corymbosa var. corymbosa TaxID=529605 RepID=A0AAV1CYS5_OLDCO|nr:OLC1v1037760C1 [Oldenlandia corymbosa var. corymbosa]
MSTEEPNLVEDGDSTAAASAVFLKSYRNSVPIPRHWREYLEGKLIAAEKKPYQLPEYIVATGIEAIRPASIENEDSWKMDLDDQVLHDAFFKYQTKPRLTSHGDLYFDGKEFEKDNKLEEPKPIMSLGKRKRKHKHWGDLEASEEEEEEEEEEDDLGKNQREEPERTLSQVLEDQEKNVDPETWISTNQTDKVLPAEHEEAGKEDKLNNQRKISVTWLKTVQNTGTGKCTKKQNDKALVKSLRNVVPSSDTYSSTTAAVCSLAINSMSEKRRPPSSGSIMLKLLSVFSHFCGISALKSSALYGSSAFLLSSNRGRIKSQPMQSNAVLREDVPHLGEYNLLRSWGRFDYKNRAASRLLRSLMGD